MALSDGVCLFVGCRPQQRRCAGAPPSPSPSSPAGSPPCLQSRNSPRAGDDSTPPLASCNSGDAPVTCFIVELRAHVDDLYQCSVQFLFCSYLAYPGKGVMQFHTCKVNSSSFCFLWSVTKQGVCSYVSVYMLMMWYGYTSSQNCVSTIQ